MKTFKLEDDKSEWDPKTYKRETIVGANGKGEVTKIYPPRSFPRKSVLDKIQQKDYLFALILVNKALFNKQVPNIMDINTIKVKSFKQCFYLPNNLVYSLDFLYA